MGTYFDIITRILQSLVRHPLTRQIANYAVRQATAAVVREVRRRTRNARRGTMTVS